MSTYSDEYIKTYWGGRLEIIPTSQFETLQSLPAASRDFLLNVGLPVDDMLERQGYVFDVGKPKWVEIENEDYLVFGNIPDQLLPFSNDILLHRETGKIFCDNRPYIKAYGETDDAKIYYINESIRTFVFFLTAFMETIMPIGMKEQDFYDKLKTYSKDEVKRISKKLNEEMLVGILELERRFNEIDSSALKIGTPDLGIYWQSLLSQMKILFRMSLREVQPD